MLKRKQFHLPSHAATCYSIEYTSPQAGIELTNLIGVKYNQIKIRPITYHRFCKQSNTMGVRNGAGIAYPAGPPDLTLEFQQGSCCSIFGFMYGVLWIFDCPFVLLSYPIKLFHKRYLFHIVKLQLNLSKIIKCLLFITNHISLALSM